jgi:hypothetical protein
MLKFAEYLQDNESNFLDYLNYIEENTEPLDRGAKSSFRGKLNELAFVNAFNRYHELLKKYKGDHDKAIKNLASEGPLDHRKLDKNGQFSENILGIKDKLGDEETNRTLWDSHHSALAAINHIHENSGGITGAPVWSGIDNTGKTVEKLTGYNTPADMVVPTKNGWNHLSLKYSEKEKPSPTKLSQRTAEQMAEHIQRAHIKNFGKRDENLDSRLKELQTSFGSSSLNDDDVKNKLLKAGFVKNNKGEFSKSKISKLARYSSELQKIKDLPEKADRANKLRSALQDHFSRNGISEKNHDKHIKNLANIYDNVLKSNKRKSSIAFMDSLHNSVKKIYNEGKKGQHELVKNLLNINPPGNGRFMVIKTQRSGKDYKKDQNSALPQTSVADHSKNIDDSLKGIKEHEAYDSVKTDKTASATIARKKGQNVASLALETSKSVPTIVASAGKDIDKFDDISNQHPLKKETSVAPARVASKPRGLINDSQHGPYDFYNQNEKNDIRGNL